MSLGFSVTIIQTCSVHSMRQKSGILADSGGTASQSEFFECTIQGQEVNDIPFP